MLSGGPSGTAAPRGGASPYQPGYFTQVAQTTGKRAAQQAQQPEVPQIVEVTEIGDDERDFHITGQFEDPYLGIFKLIDRKRSSTVYEREVILSFDPSYKRALLVGQTFVISGPPKKLQTEGIEHIKGPQWIFEELKRRAQLNRDRFQVPPEEVDFKLAESLATKI